MAVSLYVFLSNEDDVNVHFDNLLVEHYKGKLLEENHYYPYGLTLSTQYQMVASNKTLWGSKKLEHQEFVNGEGLQWYNYDVRPYDPQIGRWHNADLLAEQAPNWSPYRYCYSNPVNYTDPSGLKEVPQEAHGVWSGGGVFRARG
jgi:RHS repeat-associated protein